MGARVRQGVALAIDAVAGVVCAPLYRLLLALARLSLGAAIRVDAVWRAAGRLARRIVGGRR